MRYRIEFDCSGTWMDSAMTPGDGFCCRAAAALRLAQRLADDEERRYRIVGYEPVADGEPQAGIVADALASVERVEARGDLLKQRIAETVAEAWDREGEL